MAQIDNNAATATIRSLVNCASGFNLHMDQSIPSLNQDLIMEDIVDAESMLVTPTNNVFQREDDSLLSHSQQLQEHIVVEE